MIPLHAQLQWKSKYYNPEVLVEVIWVCKVNDSCKQTLDSPKKFYLFNDWLNESFIMIYWRLQLTTLAVNKLKFSCDKLFCNLLSRVSILLHTRQKRLLTVVMVKMQDYPKLLIGAHRISFWLRLFSYGGFHCRYRVRKILVSWLFWVAF